MPSLASPLNPLQRQVFALGRLSDAELLTRAKADLLTRLATDVLAVHDIPSGLVALTKLLDTVRVFREKTARAAGLKLAPIVAASIPGGADNFCKKTKYCDRRQALRDKLDAVRKAVSAAQVVQELADLGEFLATVIAALADLKLPLSIIFLIFLYTLDVICKCPDKPATASPKQVGVGPRTPIRKKLSIKKPSDA